MKEDGNVFDKHVKSLWSSASKYGEAASEKKGVAPATRRIALAAVLIGLAVVLSPFYVPLGDTKVFPAQHMINVLAGILLGPWWAVFMALATGTIRNMLGLGTIYAYPGGVFGGLVVGIVYKYIKRTDYAALLESLGTVFIGGSLSALVVSPYLGRSATLYFFWTAFAVSCIPGSMLGLVILKALRHVRIDRYLL